MGDHMSKGHPVEVHRQMCKHVVWQCTDKRCIAVGTCIAHSPGRARTFVSPPQARVPLALHPPLAMSVSKHSCYTLLKPLLFPCQRHNTQLDPSPAFDNPSWGFSLLCASRILESCSAFLPLELHWFTYLFYKQSLTTDYGQSLYKDLNLVPWCEVTNPSSCSLYSERIMSFVFQVNVGILYCKDKPDSWKSQGTCGVLSLLVQPQAI